MATENASTTDYKFDNVDMMFRKACQLKNLLVLLGSEEVFESDYKSRVLTGAFWALQDLADDIYAGLEKEHISTSKLKGTA